MTRCATTPQCPSSENYAALQKKYEQTHKIARFRTGEKLPYWGRLIKLKTQLAAVNELIIACKHGFYVEHPNYPTSQTHDEAIEAALHNYLKERFSFEVHTFARNYGKVLGIEPTSLRITEMTRCWGSCSAASRVSIDWCLVYAPKRVAAYVVAHELAHLKLNNHRRQFWQLLRQVYGEHQREHE